MGYRAHNQIYCSLSDLEQYKRLIVCPLKPRWPQVIRVGAFAVLSKVAILSSCLHLSGVVLQHTLFLNELFSSFER